MVLVNRTRLDQSDWFRSRFIWLMVLSLLLLLAILYALTGQRPTPNVPPAVHATPYKPQSLLRARAERSAFPQTSDTQQAAEETGSETAQAVPAFPGAAGFGAESRGGRGGAVLIVDRLDDPCPTVACTSEDLDNPDKATPGTLRWALTRDYPRTVVFRVSGIIRLQEDQHQWADGQLSVTRLADIRIRHPYLTIAGQTAPAGGITIAGNGLTIKTHDVVIRYLRFRTGRGQQPVYPGQQNPETLMIENGAERVIIDHCSFSWMPAEGVSIFTGELWDSDGGTARDINLSWNLIAEGLVQHPDGRGHPSAAFMAGVQGEPTLAADKVVLHHNLLAHTQKRNGDLLIKRGQLVNNLIYNWQWLPTVLAGAVEADLIGNIWKPGPQSAEVAAPSVGVHLVPAARSLQQQDPLGWWHAVPGQPSLYLSGNAFGADPQPLDNQVALLCYYRQRGGECRNDLMAVDWFRAAPMAVSAWPLEVSRAEVAESAILAAVGASQRVNALGQWVNNRDLVDSRYVAEYRSSTYLRARFPWHQDDVGGYPRQIEGDPYPDADGDGMSDWWELKQGLNPADPTDANRLDPRSSYTYLEVFINGLSPVNKSDFYPVRSAEHEKMQVFDGIAD